MEAAVRAHSERFRTTNPYEQKFGYSRAVRRGPFIFVSGTTSIDCSSGEILHLTSAFDQTLKIFDEILLAVQGLGGKKEDVVRVRMFVTDEDAEEVGRGLKTAFGDVAPAATMIIGAKFVPSQMKVEIEADAVIA